MPIERPTFHESWYRVADIHPKLRADVQESRQHFRGQPWHVLQDHSNNAFFRLAEPAYRFIGLLDGKRSVADAWKITNEQLGDDAPTQGEVIQLLGQLYTANLLQADVPADTHTLFAQYKKRKQREISSYLMNIMFSRVPIFDPDWLLKTILPLVGWIFSPIGFVVWIVLIGFGLHALFSVPGWQDKVADPAGKIIAPDNLIGLYIAFALIKACHEMGHAISCKKFGVKAGTGGEVHIIGIMFLIFTPVPYVDASSSWALQNKWHRMIVGAAGMWVELVIASVAAMVWANTNDANWVHNFAYNIMFVAGFSTLVFNANPLLRYDGYYMLSDVLEIPNLAQRGKDYFYYLVKKYIWRVRNARNPAHAPTEKFWLFVYAVASFIMRIFVTFSIMFYLTGVLNGTLIILATAMALAGLITWALVPLGKFVHYLVTSSELSRVRAWAMTSSFVFIGGSLAILGFVKVPDHSRAQGVVEAAPGYSQELFPLADGIVAYANVDGRPDRAGDSIEDRVDMPVVKKGDLILQTKNPQRENDLARRLIQQEQAELKYHMALDLDPGAFQITKNQIKDTQDDVALSREQIERLTLKSPISGVLVVPDLEPKQYAYVKQTDHLGRVTDIHKLIVRASAKNELSGLLNEEKSQYVEMRVEGRADILFTGRIYQYSLAGSKNLPSPSLGYQVGGELTTAQDSRQGTETVENFFEVRIDQIKLKSAPPEVMDQFKNTTDVPLFPGQRVTVRFTFAPKPMAVQAWTALRQVFQKKFQL